MTFWNNPINFIGGWLNGLLTGWHLPEALATILIYVIGITVLIVFAMVLDIGLVWVERKVVARFQDRLGPEPDRTVWLDPAGRRHHQNGHQGRHHSCRSG